MMHRRHFIAGLAGLLLPAGLGKLWAGDGTVHVVRQGDTLSGIAARYGTTVRDLKAANNLKSDLIKVGQALRIPDAGSAAAMARILSGVRVEPGRWQYIVGHHSGIGVGNAQIYDSVHRRRGMENGLAYHFVIGNGSRSGDGEIEVGDRWKRQLDGGHVRKAEVNQHGIGICLVGNFEETRPTRRQMESFTRLVDYLGGTVLKGRYTFTVHREVDRNHTVCPGKNFPLREMHRRYG